MPEHPDQDLDDRIRQLVTRAVSDAPAPPDVGPNVVPLTSHTPSHRRWWIGGGAAVLAAAAVITALVLVGDNDERISTPSETVPATVAPTVPGRAPTPVTPAPTITAAPTTVQPTTAPGAVPTGDGTTIVTAGADGVHVLTDGVEVRALPTPASIGLLTPGGAVIFQPAPATTDADPGDPQIWRADGSVEDLLGPAGADRSYRLHDIASIEGVPTVLYGVRTGGPALEPAEHTEVVHALALNPDGHWTTTQVADVNTWEGGFSRLSLSDGGTVVGTAHDLVTSSFFTATVPGSPDAATGDHLSLPGVEPSYSECDAACPSGFTISSDGSLVAWMEGSELVALDVAAGTTSRADVASRAEQLLAALDVSPADHGVDAVVSFADTGDGAPPPHRLAVDAEGAVTDATLTGAIATLWSTSVATSPPTASTTIPTTIPPVDATSFVTTGPVGVVRHDGTATTTLTSEPVATALQTGDGTVIVQRRAADFSGDESTYAATTPQVIGGDGSLSPLFGTVDWGGAVTLHDVETVAGSELLLYSVQVGMVNPDAADETLFVVDLATQERTPIGQIGGWEWGTARLHLATTGLIVGQSSSGASVSVLIEAVPGSPAAAGLPTAASLGLQDTYPDCDCPTMFTVTPDGAAVAWIDAGRIWRVPVSGGTPAALAAVPKQLAVDLDVRDETALVSFYDSTLGSGDPPRPVLVPLDGSAPLTLEGVAAAFAPAG